MGEEAPKVEIMLDKPRHMQFTIGVAKRFKGRTGKAITDIKDNLDIDDFSILLHLMLQVEDKELTQEAVDDMLHMRNVKEYVDKMMLLIDESTPPVPEGEDPKVIPEKITSPSGPSDVSASVSKK